MNTIFVHDLNNKMTVLIASIDLIDHAIESNDLDKIKQIMGKVKRYISNTADFVKTSLKEAVDPRVLACDVIKNIDSKINIEINKVQNGTHKIKQSSFISVMENIVKNAEETTNVTKIRVYITPSSITIFDNGQGFTHDILRSFHDGKHKTTKKNGTGTGLLSIKTNMKAMGYKMSIGNKNPGSYINFKRDRFG